MGRGWAISGVTGPDATKMLIDVRHGMHLDQLGQIPMLSHVPPTLSRSAHRMRAGVPSWQAAAAVLLHSLAGPGTGQRSVRAWVAARTEGLIDVGMGLLETGARATTPCTPWRGIM